MPAPQGLNEVVFALWASEYAFTFWSMKDLLRNGEGVYDELNVDAIRIFSPFHPNIQYRLVNTIFIKITLSPFSIPRLVVLGMRKDVSSGRTSA